MELKKTNETVNKQYDESNNATETVQSVQYQILDGDNIVGNANIYNGGYSLNVNKGNGIESLTQEVLALFA